MKKSFLKIATISFIAIFMTTLSFAQSHKSSHPEGTLVVKGIGTVSIAPSIAVLSIDIIAENKDYQACIESLDKKSENIKSTLKKAGFSSKSIKTSGFSINRDMKYNSQLGKSEFIGFKASHKVSIRIDNNNDEINKAFNAIAGSLTDAGFYLGFDLNEQEKEKAKNEIIKNAVSDAKQKAELIANASGVELDRIIDIRYGELNLQPVYPSYKSRANAMVMSEGAAPSLDFDINASDIKHRDEITIIWSIK
ncbi:SIMPL domain-containing protein [Aureibacter tunicatorum]|uniref:DUF541 domain-containing protein n=1 Tax=Aureibacter tunicatorum TaxID=866807 RepID=A0AAE4BT24_9BACT|nr:SIMPL domain-containing protein [Aureibacter tunicatorum]MDR6239413.1 hypothetical protein [Aureibacter tunicatorum]BDD04664.1 hypothetical protein AUTU_21470 [Aureibacter tunicatorum]